MAVTETTPYVSYIQDSQAKNHPIAAPYAILNKDGATPTYVSFDDLSLGVDYTVAASLPTASAAYKGKIYLIQDSSDVEGGSYIEYICVNTSGTTWAWEPIGTTKINVSVSSVSEAQDTVTVKYSKANANTGYAGAVTINGSNFTFGGTAAAITVPAHSHTMSGTTRYLKKTTYNTTSVVASLATTSINPAGSAVNVVTGYENPTTASVLTGVTGTATKYGTTTLYTNGTITVATAGSAKTVATGLSGDTTFVKTVGAISTTYLTKSNIYPAADVTALRKADVTVGNAVSLTSSLGAATMISAASAGTTNVFNGATVSADGILSFNTTTVNNNFSATSKNITDTNIIPSVTVGNGISVRGTSVPYLTGATTSTATGNVLVAYGKAGDTNGTVSASTTSITPVGGTTSVATRGTSYTVITGTSTTATTGFVSLITEVSGSGSANAITALGTASTAAVATVGNAVTVATGASTTANALTSSSSASVFTDVTTTSTGNQAFITALGANTGEKAAESIAYTPAGTISGSQSVAAHSHSVSTAATSASVTVTGHTHTVTLSGGSVN